MSLFHTSRPPRTMNVAGYAEPGGAGRSPDNVGKFHLHLELLFENRDEARAWMKRNGIPTVIFDRRAAA